MKKIYYLLFLLPSSIILAACNIEDREPTEPVNWSDEAAQQEVNREGKDVIDQDVGPQVEDALEAVLEAFEKEDFDKLMSVANKEIVDFVNELDKEELELYKKITLGLGKQLEGLTIEDFNKVEGETENQVNFVYAAIEEDSTFTIDLLFEYEDESWKFGSSEGKASFSGELEFEPADGVEVIIE